MSTTLTLQGNKSATTSILYPDTNYSSDITVTNISNGHPLYIGFDSLTGANRYKNIEFVRLYLYGTNESTTQPYSMYFLALHEPFVENTITHRNAPESDAYTGYLIYSAGFTEWAEFEFNLTTTQFLDLDLAKIRKILSNGIKVIDGETGANANITLHTTRSTFVPYILMSLSDSNSYLSITNPSPSSGFIPKYSANTFSWGAEQVGVCLATDLTIASSKFRWKPQGGSATEIDCGTSLSCTVPANTFTTNTILWQAEITDSIGNVNTTDWFTMTTAEETSSAVIVSPKNIVIDGSASSLFNWQHIIGTGTLPTKSELEKSSDGTTWTSLATVTNSNTYVVIPADTFTSGTWYWRVRTYNTDDVSGAWSDVESFVVIAAPAIAGVTATNEPRPRISWQSTDQTGYQIQIDDIYDSGAIFGADNSCVSPRYLADGAHTIKVRVQNQYGLWSAWGTASVNITHTEGPAITLVSASASGFASLNWTRDVTYSEYLVYRDGIVIAKTSDTSYIDYYTVGVHTYKILGIYSNSMNYGQSNSATVNVDVDELTIIDTESLESVTLRYSENSFDKISISRTQEYALMSGTATEYPIAEKSKHKTLSMTIDFAFKNDDPNVGLINAMIGNIVCVKTPNEAMVIGPFANVSSSENTFYTEYRCTIQQISWDEEILLW